MALQRSALISRITLWQQALTLAQRAKIAINLRSMPLAAHFHAGRCRIKAYSKKRSFLPFIMLPFGFRSIESMLSIRSKKLAKKRWWTTATTTVDERRTVHPLTRVQGPASSGFGSHQGRTSVRQKLPITIIYLRRVNSSFELGTNSAGGAELDGWVIGC